MEYRDPGAGRAAQHGNLALTYESWVFSNDVGTRKANFRLVADGSVLNHKHRNEHSWRATEDGMEFLSPDGNVTSRLVWVSATRLKGRLTTFCTGYRPEALHVLEQDVFSRLR